MAFRTEPPAGSHDDDGGWTRITFVADDEYRISSLEGTTVLVVVVESRSPRSVVMIVWCSIVPSGSMIVLWVVVVGPFFILTLVQVSTPPLASSIVPLMTVLLPVMTT